MSIITELQKNLLDDIKPLSSILRKAHFISKKLGLKDMSNWIENEMNGYSEVSVEDYPSYRILTGIIKANNPIKGWEQVVFDSKSSNLEEKMSKKLNNQSITELETLLLKKEDYLGFSLPSSFSNNLQIPMPCVLMIDRSQIAKILSNVRNRLLDWTLELDQNGIKGENMEFLDSEVKKAQETSTNIIYNISNSNVQTSHNNENSTQAQDNRTTKALWGTLWNAIKKVFTWWKN